MFLFYLSVNLLLCSHLYIIITNQYNVNHFTRNFIDKCNLYLETTIFRELILCKHLQQQQQKNQTKPITTTTFKRTTFIQFIRSFLFIIICLISFNLCSGLLSLYFYIYPLASCFRWAYILCIFSAKEKQPQKKPTNHTRI